jgi:hypothetical protein
MGKENNNLKSENRSKALRKNNQELIVKRLSGDKFSD